MGQLTRQGFLTAQTATAKRETCGDCGTKEGQLHILGCDMERCAALFKRGSSDR